jgi:hypothetical protein
MDPGSPAFAGAGKPGMTKGIKAAFAYRATPKRKIVVEWNT